MSEVPAVPPGASPYQTYLDALQQQFYHTPSDGFRSRLITLYVLTSIYMLLAIAWSLLLVPQLWRRGELWLFRRVRKGDSKLIVTNIRLVVIILGLVQGAVSIDYIEDQWAIFLEHGNLRDMAATRSFHWVALFVSGWVISCGSLNAFLLASTTDRTSRFTPRLSNLLFFGGGAGFLILGLGIAINATLAGNSLVMSYEGMAALLTRLQAKWIINQTTEFADLLDLNAAYTTFVQVANDYQNSLILQYSLLPLFPFCVVLVSLSALFLVRHIGTQINYQTTRLSMHDGAPAVSLPSPGLNGAPAISRATSGPTKEEKDIVPPVSSATVRRIALDMDSGEQEKQQALLIIAFRKARGDLLVVATSVIVYGTMLMGQTIFIAVSVGNNSYITGRWSLLEGMLFSVEWTNALVQLSGFTYLLFNQIRNGAVDETGGRRGSVDV